MLLWADQNHIIASIDALSRVFLVWVPRRDFGFLSKPYILNGRFYRIGEKSNAKDSTHSLSFLPANLRLPQEGLIYLMS
jgi:hypothetical protein